MRFFKEENAVRLKAFLRKTWREHFTSRVGIGTIPLRNVKMHRQSRYPNQVSVSL
ncbi:hypothetical protein GA0061094_1399 [[Bacillus] enclensis]|uniref:Uncharacterized protein n=1 Tax=[Bacillus] enclensis TaxID=1402860 RepID=A0A1C4ABC6_9BACI|nr:hypothetical protein I7V34_11075 [Bacillus sp. V3]SCB91899.1 hypothetical protein GA0061094_1399 [[Bacillus] enclensis]